ncbi:hypothetical protein, partial [Hyphomicrobium sp. 2TAF46]|uniref:hypothetical protein n=1 Tax=Hyphomicrobium sp. 2TAF46 TaxID=3233019 RepID=UPI003F8DF6FE
VMSQFEILACVVFAASFIGTIAEGHLGVAERQTGWVRAGNECERITGYKDLPAKSRYVLGSPFEHIVISCPSPKIGKATPFADLKNIEWGDGTCGRKWRGTPEIAGSRTEEISCSWTVAFDQIKRTLNWPVCNNAINEQAQILSSSVTAILPSRLNAPVVVSREEAIQLPNRIDVGGKNKGAPIRYQGLFREASLIGSGAPEGERESCDHDCCECGNDGVVGLNESARTPQFYRRSVEQRVLPVFGFGGCAVLLALYARLKAIGNRDRPNADKKGKKKQY